MATHHQAAHAIRYLSYAALILLACLWASGESAHAVCTPSGTLTTNLSMCEPTSGETGWASAINGNFTILDAIFGASGTTVNMGSLDLGAAMTLQQGTFGMMKVTPSLTAPGAVNAKFEVVCGNNPGTAQLVMYAGTSAASTTVVNNVGAGVTGC